MRDLFSPPPVSAVRLSDAQRLDWLRLIRSQSVGPRTFQTLLNKFGGAAAALDVLPDLLKKSGKADLRICSRAEAEREMTDLAGIGARLVAKGEADYPSALAETDTAPPLLSVLGDISALSRPAAAIVGARNASAAGCRMAERLALGLGHAGLLVASGLARGIDTHAHQASVVTGTVAVLAGGLGKPYPSENRTLLERLVETGCAVSEMPLTWEPRGQDFPRRNRIISGLSLGTIVIEAARRSGSLITARFALEQGREVFAVPGSPLDPRAEGVNDLIRSGATLVTRADDVLQVLAPQMSGGAPVRNARDEADRAVVEPLWEELDLFDRGDAPATAPAAMEGFVIEERAAPGPDSAMPDRLRAYLSPTPVEVDDLVRLLAASSRDVQAALFDLELQGVVERHAGGRVSLSTAT